MTSPRVSLLLAFVAIFAAANVSSFGQAARRSSTTEHADEVVRALCGKHVALLGESPLHGFGRTLEFKAAIIPRLVDECQYNAFFVESGIYDFLNIQKKLESDEEVTEPMITAAIGGLWATREVQPLIPFLLERAKAGRVLLGGLDDQLQRGTYAQHEMPSDLVAYLEGDEKARCLGVLRKHTLWQYTDDSPYGPKDKALVLGCLDSIEASLTKLHPSAAPFVEYNTAMVDSLKRLFARDFRRDVPKGVDEDILDRNDRDRSMYLNLRWLLARLPAHRKVIVWAANIHVAKGLSEVPGEEGLVPFGLYVRQEFKNHSFALGFSAYSGSYAMAGQPVRPLSVAPGGSMEAQALAGRDSDTAYLPIKELHKLGPVAARPLGSSFKTARWSDVLDGVLIFREEHPPDFVRR